MTNTLARRNDTALSLEDRIEAIKEATNEHHANALSAARSAFHVAFCADQALDAITAS
jgi:hypothetical protein